MKAQPYSAMVNSRECRVRVGILSCVCRFRVWFLALAMTVVGFVAVAQASSQHAVHIGLLNSIEVATNPSREIAQWQRFSRKYRDEKAVYVLCDTGGSLCSPGLKRWRGMLQNLRGADRYDMLDEVNRSINGLVTYRNDNWVPGLKDRWASPLEAVTNGGDCEDIALLKYISLLELGVAEKNLRLVVVKIRRSNQGHALLAVKLDKSWIILDSLNDEIESDMAVTNYMPLYSISGKRRWLHLAYRIVSQNVP